MCTAAFQQGLGWTQAHWLLAVIIFCFALTTLITWAFCYERALIDLNPRLLKPGRLFFLAMIPIGAVVSIDGVWKVGDIAFNLMLMVNIVGIVRLLPSLRNALNPWIRQVLSARAANSKS
jgi:AGCS family alanine or glycine:cation symporter